MSDTSSSPPPPPPSPESEPGFEGVPAPEIGSSPSLSPEATTGLGRIAFMNASELPSAPETPTEMFNQIMASTYYALQERLQSPNPVATQEELAIGAFVEEIQPQARDAVLLMRQKGYNVGNVLHAGFMGENHELQGMTLLTPLSAEDRDTLQEQGFMIEDGELRFQPENPLDFGSIKERWDWLADTLPDLGEPAGPAMFGNAVAFREAAEHGTLLDYYMPNGIFDPVGTKYLRERDSLADADSSWAAHVAAATREHVISDQRRELQARLASNPAPTDEEWSMGLYKERIEPQVRDAVLEMRRRGYDTYSSGFWGRNHDEQAVDIATPLDEATLIWLAERNIKVSDTGTIHFKPDDPSNLDKIKKTWDMIAANLPDLGRHANPAQDQSAKAFRLAVQNRRYGDIAEIWYDNPAIGF